MALRWQNDPRRADTPAPARPSNTFQAWLDGHILVRLALVFSLALHQVLQTRAATTAQRGNTLRSVATEVSLGSLTYGPCTVGSPTRRSLTFTSSTNQTREDASDALRQRLFQHARLGESAVHDRLHVRNSIVLVENGRDVIAHAHFVSLEPKHAVRDVPQG